MQQKKQWPFKTITFEIEDEQNRFEKTKILINNHLNCIFMIITQMNKMGVLISSSINSMDITQNLEMMTPDVETVFGSQQNQEYEIFTRSLFGFFYDTKTLADTLGILDTTKFRNPFMGKPLLLSIALEKIESMENQKILLKRIKDEILKRLIKFF